MQPRRLLLIATLVLVAIIAICCGAGLLLVGVGEQAITSDVAEQIHLLPEVQEHIGDIETLEPNWSKSLNEPESDETTSMVYQVEGSLSSGQIRTEYKLDEDSHATVVQAELILEDGTVVPLSLQPR